MDRQNVRINQSALITKSQVKILKEGDKVGGETNGNLNHFIEIKGKHSEKEYVIFLNLEYILLFVCILTFQGNKY